MVESLYQTQVINLDGVVPLAIPCSDCKICGFDYLGMDGRNCFILCKVKKPNKIVVFLLWGDSANVIDGECQRDIRP